jgi:hypothetical protein
MEYRIMESADSLYENVRSIRLGEGKRLWVYKGDEPFLAVDINIPQCFFDAILFKDYLVIGNYFEGIYFINLDDLKIQNIKVTGYFGHFEVEKDRLYVLGCEDVMAFDERMELLWQSEPLAVDGVVCDAIDGDRMVLSCEMDPPGGWVERVISLKDGSVLK